MNENVEMNLNGGNVVPETPAGESTQVVQQSQNVVNTNNNNVENNNGGNVEEKMYSKAQVQELMRKRVERSHNSFFQRYEVENLDALDKLFEKAKGYQTMSDERDTLKLENGKLIKENTFLKNDINPDKYDDIETYYKGKGIDFTEEGFLKDLESHQEWKKVKPMTTTIQNIGMNQQPQQNDSERELASRIFGVKL